MRLIQILGNNGAGKSALVRALVGSHGPVQVDPPVTRVPDAGTVVVGYYGPSAKTGKPLSLENAVHTKVGLLAALDAALVCAQRSGATAIVWEAIILMTRQYHAEYLARGLRPVYIHLDLPLAECFQRIEGRGGKTAAQTTAVAGRHRFVERLAVWCAARAPTYQFDGLAPIDENLRRLRRAIGQMGVADGRSRL